MRVTAREFATPRRRRPPPRRERDVQAAILAYLRTVPGVVAWRNNVGAVKTGSRFVRFGIKGLPDIIGWQNINHGRRCFGAQFLAIEVKSQRGQLSAPQVAFKQLATEDGVLYIEARSLDDVLAALR